MHKIFSYNLQHHLLQRESNITPGCRHPTPHCFLFHDRLFYRSVTPRLSVLNVDQPDCYVHKFTPDGQLMITFTQDRKSINVYRYLGVGSVADLLVQKNNECITDTDMSLHSRRIRRELFHSLFKKKFYIPIAISPTYGANIRLDSELVLFLEKGNFVLSLSYDSCVALQLYPIDFHYPDIHVVNPLHINLHLVDLKKGCLTDTLQMRNDYVELSYFHKVSVYDRFLGFLSVLRQCIDIVELDAKFGKLQRLLTVGTFGSDMDKELFMAHLTNAMPVRERDRNFPFFHLKQKILAFQYRQIMKLDSPSERQEQLNKFYKEFPKIEHMLIVKAVLVDSDHLLLRFGNNPIELIFRGVDFRYLVLYNMPLQQVLKACSGESIDLLTILRLHCDEFQNVQPSQVPWSVSSFSKNYYCRKNFDNTIALIPFRMTETAADFHEYLPINSHICSTSPYLDLSLLNNDENPKRSKDEPIRCNSETVGLMDRCTGIAKFRVFLKPVGLLPSKFVLFIFHPYEPFFISVQKFGPRLETNFHLYNSTTIIKD